MELELISSLFGNNMERQAGPDVLPEHFQFALNLRPSRCEPLKAYPCIQLPIELLEVAVQEY